MEKGSVKTKKVIIVLFMVLLCLPAILYITGGLLGETLDQRLSGTSSNYPMPEFSVSSYLNREYQKKTEDHISHKMPLNGLATKIYNQLRFSLFKEGPGNNIVGKNGDLFQDVYIAGELCLNEGTNYAEPENMKKFEDYLDKMVSISNKLEGFGKKFLYIIAPSKARYNFENIPDKYFEMAPEERIRGYDAFMELIKDRDLEYIYAGGPADEIKALGIPLFYESGTHWSRPFEQVADWEIIEKAGEVLGINVRNMVKGELVSKDTPYYRDEDLYEIFNLFSPSPTKTFYQYERTPEEPGDTTPLRITLQGDSYSKGMLYDYFNTMPDTQAFFIYYNNYVVDTRNNGKQMNFNGWEDADLQLCLDNSDIIAVELVECQFFQYSNGFIDYLDKFLDTYVPGETEGYCHKSLDPKEGTGLKRAFGYYGFERDFVWASPDSCLLLKDKDFSTKGMEIRLELSEYTSDGDTDISIYVNGRNVLTRNVKEAGEQEFFIPGEYFDAGDIAYPVEIICSDSFIPKDLGMGEDKRELSLKVRYAGVKR